MRSSFLVLIGICMLSPFPVIETFGKSVRVSNLATVIILLSFVLHLAKRKQFYFDALFGYIAISFMLLSSWYVVSALLNNADIESAMLSYSEVLLYLTMSFSLVQMSSKYSIKSLSQELSSSAFPLFFFGVVFVVFLAYRSIHENIVLLSFLSTSGLSELQYSVFSKIFGGDASSAARHSSAYAIGAVLVISCCCFSGSARVWMAIFAVILLAILASRQAILAVALTAIVFLISSYSRAGHLFLYCILGLVAFGVLVSFVPNESFEYLEYKFVQDILHNPRVEQFYIAIYELENYFFLGKGYGVLPEGAAFPHNLILFSFHQGGIFALVLSIVVYALVILLLLDFMISRKDIDNVSIQIRIVSVYFLLCALVKLSVGVKGDLDFVTWTFLSLSIVIRRICYFDEKLENEGSLVSGR